MQNYSNEMHREHKFTHCWTNITTVLSWIASLAKLKIYGSNKYIEIFILCEAGQSKHVSEILRKADSAKQTNELKYVNRLWLDPLDFLLTIEAIWRFAILPSKKNAITVGISTTWSTNSSRILSCYELVRLLLVF